MKVNKKLTFIFLTIILVVVGIIIFALFKNKDYKKFQNDLISSLEKYGVTDISLNMYNPSNEYGYNVTIKGNSETITAKEIHEYMKYVESNHYTKSKEEYYYVDKLFVYINNDKYFRVICTYDCLEVNDEYILNVDTDEKKVPNDTDNTKEDNIYPKPADVDLWGMAREICESYLKAPSSANFSSLSSTTIKSLGNDKYSISGTVEAQNSFGVMLKQNYYATLTFTGKGYKNGYCTIN